MMASFTALLTRTLRLDARAFATYALRFALAGLVLTLFSQTNAMSSRMFAAGRFLLSELAFTVAGFITIFGISHFSSVITEEKEEQTIGLLRMAGLRPSAIVLAKSGARAWNMLLLLGAILPFALLAVSLGGVSTLQVLACAVALIAYLLMLSGLGVLVSVMRPTSSEAASWLVALLITTQAVPLMFEQQPWAHAINAVSVWFRLSDILFATVSTTTLVSSQTWVSLGVAALSYYVALKLFNRCVRDEDSLEPARVVVRPGLLKRLFGAKRPYQGIWALVNKDLQVQCGGRFLMVLKPVLLLSLITAIGFLRAYLGRDAMDRAELGTMVLLISFWWMLLEVSLHLSRLFAFEIRGQTLSTLLTLPYATTSIAYAKVLTIIIALLPAGLVFGVGIALNPEAFLRSASDAVTTISGWAQIMTVLLFWHLIWFFALTLRRGALAAALGAMLLFYLLVIIFFSTGGGGDGGAILMCFIIGFISCVLHVATAALCRSKGSQ